MSYLIKEKWKKGDVTYGAWCSLPGEDYAEALAQCGFDWICLDMQHGAINTIHMQAMIKAIMGAGKPALVRLAFNRPEYVMRALDSGASGVIAPMVESAEEGAEIVKYAKYPPAGSRSWGAVRYGGEIAGEYTPEAANSYTVTALMIETAKGLANVDEIAAVPGVDTLFVGPFDLALTHGVKPPSVSDEYEPLVYRVAEACKRHGKTAGIYCGDYKMARKWADAGLQMLACSSDEILFREAASDLARRLRGD